MTRDCCLLIGLLALRVSVPLVIGQDVSTLGPWRSITDQRYDGPMDENLGTLRPTLQYGRGSAGLGLYNAGLNPAKSNVFERMRKVYVPTEDFVSAVNARTEMRAYSSTLPLGWVSRDQGTNWTRFVVRDADTQQAFSGLINIVYYAQHHGLYLFQAYRDATLRQEEFHVSSDGEHLSPLPENRPWDHATVSWDGRIICNPRSPYYWRSSDGSAPSQFMEYEPVTRTWEIVHEFADSPQPQDYVFMNCYGEYLFRFNHLRRRISIVRRDHSVVAEDVMLREGSYVIHDDGARLSLLAAFHPGRTFSGYLTEVFQSTSFAESPTLSAPLWPRPLATETNTPSGPSEAKLDSYITLSAVVWVRGATNDVYTIESSPFSDGPWQLETTVSLRTSEPVPWVDRREYLKEGRRFYRTRKVSR